MTCYTTQLISTHTKMCYMKSTIVTIEVIRRIKKLNIHALLHVTCLYSHCPTFLTNPEHIHYFFFFGVRSNFNKLKTPNHERGLARRQCRVHGVHG